MALRGKKMIWKQPVDIEILNNRGKNSMIAYLGIEFTDIGLDFLTAKMPVDHRTHQPIGIMHGGASCVLAETVGSTAANYAVDLSTHYCVGLDINTNHIRSVREGFVYGKAQPFHLGKTTHVWGIDIRNAHDTLISVTRLTMAVLHRK
jgi:1,4-dihydroxy-2-naphthoyl-CoA hydrolase